jgi:hypothetical protein
MRTLVGGLPRPLFGARPWVALSLSSQEDRATCGLFVSGGVPAAQVRAAVEQGLGALTVEQQPAPVTPGLGWAGRLRASARSAHGSFRCASITASTRPGNCSRRCALRRRVRAG